MNLILGDCLEKLKEIDDNSVDSIVTDPPYGLSFMGKKWDYDVPSVEIWKECLRVLKPGGHLLAFAGTRTQHRMAVRIEDAGFEIRDMIAWCYGSGFPKSHDVSKALDKAAGAEREVVGKKIYAGPSGNDANFGVGNLTKQTTKRDLTAPSTDLVKQWAGWGTALKPALEPITLARKPLEGTVASNVTKWGVGGINVDGCRVGSEQIESGRSGCNECESNAFGKKLMGTEKAFSTGRFPANLLLDEEAAELLDEQTQSECSRFFYTAKASKSERNAGCEGLESKTYKTGCGGAMPIDDDGKERDRFQAQAQNHHPTVKPIKLMRYLCRLITPPNGLVLDPFMGSGSTGVAAKQEGFSFIGIEREAEYVKIAEARIESKDTQESLGV